MPDLDLLELLSADHTNLKGDVTGSEGARAIERHLTAERALLYPAVEKHLANGHAIAAQLRALDKDLVEAVLQSGATPASRSAITSALEAHIVAQESRYPDLRRNVPAERLIELADEVGLVMEEAPTHLHPHLPDGGPFREVTSEVAAIADQLRDRH